MTADIFWASGRVTRVHNSDRKIAIYTVQHLTALALESAVDHVLIVKIGRETEAKC